MGHTARQFKALTKKNFISYVRQPGCAIFQLLCPGALMLLLVWIRTKITATTPPYVNYESYKKPFFPGLEYTGSGTWSTTDELITSQRQENFLNYDNYTNGTYTVGTDMFGPLGYLPSNCMTKNSVVIPRVPSWVIANVGPSNPVQDAVTSYLQSMFALQKQKDPIYFAPTNYVWKNFAT
jgi:hypothetical protein